MSVLLIGFGIILAVTLLYAVLKQRIDYSDANEVIPGVPTRAPKEWAGAHSMEAKLHRRLRDAMSALREIDTMNGPDVTEVRAVLEREALAVDDQLVAAAALPARTRRTPLENVGRVVQAIENAVTDVVLLRGPSATGTEDAVARLRTRVALVEQARAELAGLGIDPSEGDPKPDVG